MERYPIRAYPTTDDAYEGERRELFPLKVA